jgi:hypothetical protein
VFFFFIPKTFYTSFSLGVYENSGAEVLVQKFIGRRTRFKSDGVNLFVNAVD